MASSGRSCLPAVLGPAVGLALPRGLSSFGAARLAARGEKLPRGLAGLAWVGLLPQAGLALALAVLIKRSLPTFGPQAAALMSNIAGMDQLVSPVLLRFARLRSGEANQREAEPDSPNPAPLATP